MAEPDCESLDSFKFDFELEQVKALLDALNERNVESFQGLGITVTFKDGVPIGTTVVAGDPTKEPETAVEGFRSKALWKWQNGKVLKFDGTLE